MITGCLDVAANGLGSVAGEVRVVGATCTDGVSKVDVLNGERRDRGKVQVRGERRSLMPSISKSDSTKAL